MKTNPLKNTTFVPVLLLASTGLLGGCSSFKLPEIPVPNFIRPYSIEVQQGNFVSQEMVAQLRPGMTREQVRFVLGSPLVVDVFHANRWDYVYRRELENRRDVEQRRLSVFFENDKLLRVEGDVVPAPAAGTPAAAEAPTK